MRMTLKAVLFIGLSVLSASCARAPFKPMAAVERPPASLEALQEISWLETDGVYRIRQTATLKVGFRNLPMDGVLILNTRQQEARLVGLNSMGIKYFDIELIGDTLTAHYIFPDLREIEKLPEFIGEAVRRIYLLPIPESPTAMDSDAKAQWVTGNDGRIRYRFVFEGEKRLLTEKSAVGDSQKWTARYYDYEQTAGEWIPRGITYKDARERYRLTLWMERVEKRDGSTD